MQFMAANALGTAFSQVPNKDLAWQDIHRLTQDENANVRLHAPGALLDAISQISDKDQAWQDFHRLTQDQEEIVRMHAVVALSVAFNQVPDKDLAWQDIHRLTQDQCKNLRCILAIVLTDLFSQIPDKAQAWQDLIKLTQDQDEFVRVNAANALGTVFNQVSDKDQVWQDLVKLTQGVYNDVRTYAYYSLGKASVSKAIEAEAHGKDALKKELEVAVAFFEKSSQEADSPASFCYPFYRSYLAITFQEAKEDEVQRYFAEAKEAIGGSDIKDELLKAVENLAKALQESQCLKNRSVQEVASELNAYRWYCDKAADHMAAAEDKAPEAVKLLRKCNPILEKRIDATIMEIQEKARQICKITRGAGFDFENIGTEINRAAKSLSIEDIYSTQRCSSRIASKLIDFCKLLPEDKKELVCSAVEKIILATEFPDKLKNIELALAYSLEAIEAPLQVKDLTKEIQVAKADILDRIDQSQRNTVEAVLEALDDEEFQGPQYQDLMKTLDALVELLAEIKRRTALDSDPIMKEKVNSTAKIIEDYNVNLKRKLEVTIPIIPVLLNYKWDVELEGGDINLRAAWKKLKSSLRI